jgi:hypothetical protein
LTGRRSAVGMNGAYIILSRNNIAGYSLFIGSEFFISFAKTSISQGWFKQAFVKANFVVSSNILSKDLPKSIHSNTVSFFVVNNTRCDEEFIFFKSVSFCLSGFYKRFCLSAFFLFAHIKHFPLRRISLQD